MKRLLQVLSLLLLSSFNILAATGPDLVVTNVAYETNQVQYQKFTATVTLKNIGDSPVSNFNVTNVYFSKDNTWDASDVYGGYVSLMSLEAGQSVTLSVVGGANQFGINANSEYPYLIARADYRQEVAELDENNNFWVGAINIRNASVDLTVGNFSNNSAEVLKHGELLNVSLEVINHGTDNVHNTMYEYFLSSDQQLDATDTKIGYLNWIGFYWNRSATENDELAIPATLSPAYYYVIVRINTQGQEITINDSNLDNNIVSLFRISVTSATADNVLNFDQPFGTRSWQEDGHDWSWDNSGWDNIRSYSPRTGSGHAMSAPAYSARLSTTSLLDIKGLWLQTSGSSNFSHLRVLAYDKNNVLVNTIELNPADYEGDYAYASLNLEKVNSIRFDYDVVDDMMPADLFYDDMDYVYFSNTTPPVLTCPADTEVCSGTELADYRSAATVFDDSQELTLSQYPAPGTIITETTVVTLTAVDGASNESSCTFTVVALPPTEETVNVETQVCYTFNGETYTESGTYTISYLNEKGCQATKTLHLTIKPVVVSVTDSQAGTALVANTTEGEFQWVDCNNNFAPIANETADTFVPTQSGSYAVVVTKGNCQSISECVSVNVSAAKDGGLNTTLYLYPNPGNGFFTLKSEKSLVNASVTLTSLVGRQIFKKDFSGNFFTFDITNELAGTYILEVRKNNQVSRMRLVKQ